MAGDVLFDVYGLLVENLFGSIIVSTLAMAAWMLIVLLFGRASTILVFFWMMAFILVFSVGYLGAIVLVLAFIVSAGYFMTNFIRVMYHVFT